MADQKLELMCNVCEANLANLELDSGKQYLLKSNR